MTAADALSLSLPMARRYTLTVQCEQAAFRTPDADALAFVERGGKLDISSLGFAGVPPVLTLRPFDLLDKRDAVSSDDRDDLAVRVPRPLTAAECNALADFVWVTYGQRLDNPGPACWRFIGVQECPEDD